MADVTRRRTGEMLRTLFEFLIPQAEGMQARDALAELEKRLTLTPYEQGEFASGGRRFEKIVRFSTVDLVKAGWLLKEKGRWTVTLEGKQAYQTLTDPEAFYKEAVRLFHQWKAQQPEDIGAPDAAAEEETPAKAATITLEKAEEQAWQEIDQYLRTINPYEYQEIVASLLRAMGYHISWVAPKGKDGGIDILAASDPLGTKAPRIKVQVKRQVEKVEVKGLRSFLGLLGDGDVGIFVSGGGFTKDAEAEARAQEKRKITLVDNEMLFDLWTKYQEKMNEQDRRRLPLKPVHFLALEA
jgi:restriction system protein